MATDYPSTGIRLHTRIALAANLKMPKRRRIEEEHPYPAQKKPRLHLDYDLSVLSDELILKVLTYLPISDLATCQRCVPLV